MKELIGSAIYIISLIGGGNYALKRVHDLVQRAALEKATKGLPSLTKLTRSLRGEKSGK